MAPHSLRNRFIAPTFENGVNGWTVSGTGASGVVLSASTDYSLHGTQCLKVSVPAGTGTVRLEPPSFPMIVDPYRSFVLSFSAASTTAGRLIFFGTERFKPTTFAFHNDSVTSQGLTATMQKFAKADSFNLSNAPFIGGLKPKIYVTKTTVAVDYFFDGFTWIDEADQEIFPSPLLSPLTPPSIGGSWPANDSYSYSWTGPVEASASVATYRAELIVPAAFNRGDTIAVTGTGFPPSSTANIIIADYFENRGPVASNVPTDASGNLSATVTVPYALDPGMAYIVGKPANGSIGSILRQEVWTNPTDLSGTITNYFPNPSGQTLAEDGVTPKHFGPAWYDGDVITRVSVDGGYRVRFDPEYSNMGLELGPPALNDLGLDDSKQYIVRVRMHADAVSDWDPWAYFHTSDGNSDNALVGPSPWNVMGIGTGMFDGPAEFIAYSQPDNGTVDLDQVFIVEAAAYLLGWSAPMPMAPGSTVDGYKIGLRPGREYQISGYTYGTFKVRTGTSIGSLTDLLEWSHVNGEEWPGGVAINTFAIPDGHDVIQLEASGPDDANISIHDYIPYFDGDTPDGGGYVYSWAGTPHDSASIRSAGNTGPTAQVFQGGTAKPVTEMRVVVSGGALIPITQAGS